jgi:phosphate transport system protein
MAPSHDHIAKQFDVELRTLKDRLLFMASVVEDHINAAMRALGERDVAGAEKIEKSDRQVNLMEMEIDEMCVRLLALRQPAGSDLRFICAALKIVPDLERMGELAVNIAERADALGRAPQLLPQLDLSRMTDAARGMLKDSLDAFVDGDALKAQQVLERDQIVDDLFVEAFRALIDSMKGDPATVERAVGLIFIAKHLERIADHSTNIAEMVVYLVQGKDVRHKFSVEGK